MAPLTTGPWLWQRKSHTIETKLFSFRASLSFFVSAVNTNMWHLLEGQKQNNLAPIQQCLFTELAGRSYLGEMIHYECSGDPGESNCPPVERRCCPDAAASAAAYTPVWCCAEFALKQKVEGKWLHHSAAEIGDKIMKQHGHGIKRSQGRMRPM